MAILPLNTKFNGPAPKGGKKITHRDGTADVIDDAISFFRLNIFFQSYDVRNTTDRTIIYLTLYISECLKQVLKCADKAEVIKTLTSFAMSKFDIPGDTSFPANAYFGKPADASEEDKCRQYILQLRQECSARLSERLIDEKSNKPSKWWTFLAKRKFLQLSLAPRGY